MTGESLKDLSPFAQLATILGVTSLILVAALFNLVMKRKMIVERLIIEKEHYSRESRGVRSLKTLMKLAPEWLAYKVKDTQYELILGHLALG